VSLAPANELSGGDLLVALRKLTSNTQLPRQTFPGELHLPGHQFIGPGTRLDLRPDDDDIPKHC
jgi:hypothetical protein